MTKRKRHRGKILADEIRICQNELCGAQFHPFRWWQKYCKPECNQAAYWQRKFEKKPVDPFANLEVDDNTLPQHNAMEAESQRRKELKQELEEKERAGRRNEITEHFLEELEKDLDKIQKPSGIEMFINKEDKS